MRELIAFIILGSFVVLGLIAIMDKVDNKFDELCKNPEWSVDNQDLCDK